MQQTLIFYFPSDVTAPLSWLIFDPESQRAVHKSGDSSLLASDAVAKEVIVFVPAVDILLTEAKLPKLSRARLLEALPFALEEQLIDDVQDLHFAIADQKQENVSVAVVAKAKMQAWLAQLDSWSIKPDKLLPFTFAVPITMNTWHASVLVDQVVVRTDELAGFVCDQDTIATTLATALVAAPHIESIQVTNYSDQALAGNIFPIPVQEEMLPPEALLMDASKQLQTPAINLLQGSFNRKKSSYPKVKKIWRLAACMGVLCGVSLIAYPTVSYFILKREASAVQTEIQQIYKRHFPQATALVAPRMRMQEKIKKLSAAPTEDQLFVWMTYLGQALKAANTVKLNRLDFQNNQLTVAVTAMSSEDFSTFVDALSQLGLDVKQQNATMLAERMNATLLIN